MKIYKGVALPVICAFVLVSSSIACNFGAPGPGEPGFEEPPPGEPGYEEPPPGEEPPGEPPPEPPPPEQPTQQQLAGGGGGSFSADLAVTDIYPGKQPTGQFHLRITNHGPGTLNKVNVGVSCSSERSDKNTGQLSSGGNANFDLKLSMKPGETQAFPTTLTLDTNVFDYLVGCEVHPGFDDPNPGNNVYSETLK